MILVGMTDHQGIEATHADRPQIGRDDPVAAVRLGRECRSGIEQQVVSGSLDMDRQPLPDIEHRDLRGTGHRAWRLNCQQRQESQQAQPARRKTAWQQQPGTAQERQQHRPGRRCRLLPDRQRQSRKPVDEGHQAGGEKMCEQQQRVERRQGAEQGQRRDDEAHQRNRQGIGQRRDQ